MLLDELSQLISALDKNEIEYAVCGGLADIWRLENEESWYVERGDYAAFAAHRPIARTVAVADKGEKRFG